jgi:competence protein ComEA
MRLANDPSRGKPSGFRYTEHLLPLIRTMIVEMALPDNIDQPQLAASEQPDDPASLDVATPAATSESENVLGFRPQDRRVMSVLMSVLLLWLTIEWIVAATRRPDPLLLQRGPEFQAEFRVDVNDSIWVDWMQLEGIGPSLAQRIVADRDINGRFNSIEDVARVPGIGPASLARMRPWLTIGDDADYSKSADAGTQNSAEIPRAKGKGQQKTL